MPPGLKVLRIWPARPLVWGQQSLSTFGGNTSVEQDAGLPTPGLTQPSDGSQSRNGWDFEMLWAAPGRPSGGAWHVWGVGLGPPQASGGGQGAPPGLSLLGSLARSMKHCKNHWMVSVPVDVCSSS